MSEPGRHRLLHPELLASDDPQAIVHDGRRLDHAEAASQPLRSRPEPQPRGARVHGSRPIDQAEAAARFIAAPEHEKMHDERLWDLRQKRDREMHGIDEWEELRALASAIKEHTLVHLDEYLEQFEAHARGNGVHVHWAKDAAEHNRIVHGILSDHGAKSLIKSKSMLTEECGLRPYMASVGIEVVETDLGERASSNSTMRTQAMSSYRQCTSCVQTWQKCSPRRSAPTPKTATCTISPKHSARPLGR
jgi:L-lactate dehydrogenase complex protein LldF